MPLSPAGTLGRLFDIRRSEAAVVARAATTLFLLIGAHTALETARDTLVLTRFSPGDLALAYVAVALGGFPASALASLGLAKIGPVPTLRLSLIATGGALLFVSALPAGRPSLLAVYVACSLVTTVLVPLFWNLIGVLLNVAQGRRLLGLVSAAGVFGGASGSIAAVAVVRLLPARGLIVAAALTLGVAYFVLPRAPRWQQPAAAVDSPDRTARSEPFLRWIAVLVALSTGAFLLLDFTFKWSLARSVAPAAAAGFIARYYAALNILALVVQVIIGRFLIRRASVATTVLVAPLVFFAGALATFATGATQPAILAFKAIDGSFRNSVHRVATELLYLPLSPAGRGLAKPLIDGALVRTLQGLVGMALFAFVDGGTLTATSLSAALVVASAGWLVTAWLMRAPYLALLRRSIVLDPVSPWTSATNAFDLETAEALVQLLSSEDPSLVLAAMNALERRGRLHLVPALVLLHDDEPVLTRAFALFRDSRRADWYSLARKRLRDSREPVRRVAARALAQHGKLDPADIANEEHPGARAFAALLAALQHVGEPIDDKILRDALQRADEIGSEMRLGMVSAIGLSRRDARLDPLLDRLLAMPQPSRAWRIEAARAVLSQRASRALPILISLLDHRDGREALRSAIASFGGEGVSALGASLRDEGLGRRARIHIPNTLTRIGTKEAAELALQTLEKDADGVVRYKALRALGRIAAEGGVSVDRLRVEGLAIKNLFEHFRLLGLRATLSPRSSEVTDDEYRAELLLVGLLDDKIRQSLERAFRLLKIAHPRDDLHAIHDAFASEDKRVRANASALLEAVLRRCRVPALRELLVALGEETASTDLLDRAKKVLGESPPTTREEALARLVHDRDALMAALAEELAGRSSPERERAAAPIHSSRSLVWEGAA